METIYIAFAPLQGYTDAVYRRAHYRCFGGVDEYYTPFVRQEDGAPRIKDLRDIDIERNEGIPTVPQVIAKDVDEFARLCDALQELGWKRIDLNMGCPFPMQVKAGRGSGLLQYPDRVEAIACEMQRRPDVCFSIKMRLGQTNPEEGMTLLPIINEMPLTHVTLHPRLGKQQYKGAVDMDSFIIFNEKCRHPMVYNGDITEVKATAIPKDVKGIMIGRGLLAKPWLLSDKDPKSALQDMHAEIYRYALKNLCGDSQILSRMHAFWEYMNVSLEKKQYTAVMKSTTLLRYDEAVAHCLSMLHVE